MIAIAEDDIKIKNWFAPLRASNRVFQAELLAIKFSVWGNSMDTQYSIRCDCLSAIQALYKPFNTKSLVKSFFKKQIIPILTKAYVDAPAKLAANNPSHDHRFS